VGDLLRARDFRGTPLPPPGERVGGRLLRRRRPDSLDGGASRSAGAMDRRGNVWHRPGAGGPLDSRHARTEAWSIARGRR
jgi:hypothetical protein